MFGGGWVLRDLLGRLGQRVAGRGWGNAQRAARGVREMAGAAKEPFDDPKLFPLQSSPSPYP